MARAITETAKAAKANHILEKAYELYEKGTFKSIKMIDIANASGVSKGTMFNYFSTKEKLFLEILKREYQVRFENLISSFKKQNVLDFEGFKNIILNEMESILLEDSVLMRLTAIMHNILEENLDYETALSFKLDFHNFMMTIANIIVERVDCITLDDCKNLFMTQHALIVGYRNMSNVPDVVKQVLEDHDLNDFKIDFKQNVLKAMELYLDGLYLEKTK